MVIQQDFLAYHKSIGQELKTSEKRIRNLIGRAHWLTDGEHKESILRKVITDFSPEIYRIGTGFVCYPNANEDEKNNSGQIDILITSKANPTLYKSDGLHFVTPECANAIIEVKSKLQNGQNLRDVLSKLSTEVKTIREKSYGSGDCWAGLFVYNEGNVTSEATLEILQDISDNDINAVINCISIGEHLFFRFWESGYSESGIGNDPIWHSYRLNNLSQAYFISNLVAHLSTIFNSETAEAWFPLDGGKEIYKQQYAKLSETQIYDF